MRLPQDVRETRQLARLKNLIREFRINGLCSDAAFSGFERIDSLAQLADLPVLTKSGLQERFSALQEAYAGRKDVFLRKTGGSTGEPSYHLRDRKLGSYSVGDLIVMLEIMGWCPGMPRLCLWGRDDEIGVATSDARGLRSYLSQTLWFGGYAPGEPQYREFYEAVRDNPGCAVYGYASLLEECSRFMLESNWKLKPRTVLAAWGTTEVVLPHQREIFYRAFGTHLRDFYGSRECSSISAECEYGNRHVNARYVLEAVDPDSYALLPSGEPGSLLITDLANTITPFIRYEIGDLGAVAWRECRCGRRGPCLTELLGRTCEMIPLPSGKKVHSVFFSQLLKEFPAVMQLQVERLGQADFRVNYVGSRLGEEDRRRIMEIAREMLDGASVSILQVENLELARSGKLANYIDRSGA